MMKIALLFFVLNSVRTVNSQQCRGQLNENITGNCSSVNNCVGSLLAGSSCESLRCCIPSTTFPDTNCGLTSLFNTYYNSSRGAFLRKVFSSKFQSAGICTNCQAKAAFLAIAATMTNNFQTDELMKTNAEFAADDKKYGNNQTGDGARFRRRGFFGLRGRTMYQRLQNQYPQFSSLSNPESVGLVQNSIEIAILLWNNPNLNNGTKLTKHADGSFLGFSMIWYQLGGDLVQLPIAAAYYAKFLRSMTCGGDLYPGIGQPCKFNSTHNGTCVPDCVKGMEDMGSSCGCVGSKGERCPNSPPHIQCCLDSCSQELKLDLGFVLDASGSIASADYKKQLNFTKEFLARANVGPNKTHVGIINYSKNITVITWLNSNFSLAEKQKLVDTADHFAESTYTGEALEQAKELFSYGKGRRKVTDGVTPVIFVITDGQSNGLKKPNVTAKALKDDGIILVSVGVGNGPNIQELHAICTPPASENYFAISDYAALEQKLTQFTSKSCSEPAPVPSNTTVTTEVGKDKYKFLKIEVTLIGNKILITVTLFNGKVKLFYSFNNKNPKDPADFIDPEAQQTDTWTHNLRNLFDTWFSRNQPKNNQITLVVDKPEENVEFVYLGIKGEQENNAFELKVDDCAKMTCNFHSSSSAVFINIFLLIWSGFVFIFYYIYLHVMQ